MEIIAYPSRDSWSDTVAPALRRRPCANACSGDSRRGQLDSMCAALDAFYEVEARLWALPDKAEVLPGISCAVTRRACEKVTIVLPADSTAAEAASFVAAARAVGVPDIRVSVEGGLDALCAEARHVLSAHLPAGAFAGDSDVSGRLIIYGESCEARKPDDAVVARRRGIVLVADGQSDAASIVSDATEVIEAGFPLCVVTQSVALASELPALMGGGCGALTIVLLHDAGEIVELLDCMAPQLVIAANEDCRTLAAGLKADTTVILGPMPDARDARALLTLAAPVVPVHVFTRARAVVDTLTAR